MVRSVRPRRIVEVGSGHSTRFLARAVADGALDTRITCVDPLPRARIEGLAVEWLAVPVQETSKSIFENLDILFIDSSHQLRPGSDVEYLIQEIIPALPPGVRVHFHDIFLPDGYPEQWAWRRYNEQEAVAALIGNGLLAEEFSSHRESARLTGALALLPLMPGALESSLWLRKN
ncbi:MAG TPA: class I SAM-dependent methyltransferase [Burkholderiales bacterium]